MAQTNENNVRSYLLEILKVVVWLGATNSWLKPSHSK